MYLFLFITLYLFQAHRAHHQERQICINTAYVKSFYVGGRDVCRLEEDFFQPAHISTTNIEWQLPEVVLIQFVSPDDEHDVLETCS